MNRIVWSRSLEPGLALAICLFCAGSAVLVGAETLGIESTAAVAISDEDADFFEKRVRPVLIMHCYECHSAKSSPIQGNLLLDSGPGWAEGGDSGPAIVPGKVDESSLISAINFEELEMPPSGKMKDGEIAILTEWVKRGAPDPRTIATVAAVESEVNWELVNSHWAFRPPVDSTIGPIKNDVVKDLTWANGQLDRYVQAARDRQTLLPALPASREVLIRRLHFDLTGLPPSAEQVQRFLADKHPLAYERLVDRLLADPAYGERWARPWLDLSRYAEDQAHIVGDNKALFYPNAYLYRDWVIGALNQGMAYDQFVRLQLAADQMPDRQSDIAALGFMGVGPKYYRRNDPEVMADEWEDRVDIVTRGLLGLTVACARCHDHKFDPIETEDYYAIAGVFASTEMFNQPFNSEVELNKDGHAKDPDKSYHVIRDAKNVRNLKVMIRGDAKNLGGEVSRGFLRFVSIDQRATFSKGSGRLELADQILAPTNPLTSRVWINRTWREIFGQGIVRTTSNFGLHGAQPSHPELLDYLALEFQRHAWSPKRLQRMMITSATYKQGSQTAENTVSNDPENQWLARMPRRRLSIESWRDSILLATGRLERQLGGPSMTPSKPESPQRTIYSEVSRFELDAMLALFDFPDPNNHSSGRVETTTPLQKLFLMNSSFMVYHSDQLAEEIVGHSNDDAQRLDFAFSTCFSRRPNADEKLYLLEFLRQATEPNVAWQKIAHSLLASNELLFID
jgi:hypothetical protein